MPDQKTIRDRLEKNDLVYLTRGIKIVADEKTKTKTNFPPGEYKASELPNLAYTRGYVIILESQKSQEQVKPEGKSKEGRSRRGSDSTASESSS